MKKDHDYSVSLKRFFNLNYLNKLGIFNVLIVNLQHGNKDYKLQVKEFKNKA